VRRARVGPGVILQQREKRLEIKAPVIRFYNARPWNLTKVQFLPGSPSPRYLTEKSALFSCWVNLGFAVGKAIVSLGARQNDAASPCEPAMLVTHEPLHESRRILSDAIVLVFGPTPDRYRWHRIGIGEAFEVTSTISITAAE